MNQILQPSIGNRILKILKVSFVVSVIFFQACQPKQIEQNKVKSVEFQFEEQSIAQIQQGYQSGTFTVRELVQAYLDRIQAID